jgi:hypothetical protein
MDRRFCALRTLTLEKPNDPAQPDSCVQQEALRTNSPLREPGVAGPIRSPAA